jgi:hypothetical protein
MDRSPIRQTRRTENSAGRPMTSTTVGQPWRPTPTPGARGPILQTKVSRRGLSGSCAGQLPGIRATLSELRAGSAAPSSATSAGLIHLEPALSGSHHGWGEITDAHWINHDRLLRGRVLALGGGMTYASTSRWACFWDGRHHAVGEEPCAARARGQRRRKLGLPDRPVVVSLQPEHQTTIEHR